MIPESNFYQKQLVLLPLHPLSLLLHLSTFFSDQKALKHRLKQKTNKTPHKMLSVDP